MIPNSIESLRALNALIDEAQYIKKVAKEAAASLNGYDDAKIKQILYKDKSIRCSYDTFSAIVKDFLYKQY